MTLDELLDEFDTRDTTSEVVVEVESGDGPTNNLRIIGVRFDSEDNKLILETEPNG